MKLNYDLVNHAFAINTDAWTVFEYVDAIVTDDPVPVNV